MASRAPDRRRPRRRRQRELKSDVDDCWRLANRLFGEICEVRGQTLSEQASKLVALSVLLGRQELDEGLFAVERRESSDVVCDLEDLAEKGLVRVQMEHRAAAADAAVSA